VSAKKHRKLTVAFAALLMALTCGPGERAQNASDDTQEVLAHLNPAINWYNDLTTKVPAGTEPSDSIYLNNAEKLGSQVLRLAFQSARAQVELQAQPGVSKNGQGAQPNQPSNANSAAQRYAQMENDVSQRIADDQSPIAALKQQGATKVKRAQVASQLESLQGKLDFNKASLDAVRQMKNFVESNSSGETGLKGSIMTWRVPFPKYWKPR
jgi:hypothetical protein